MPETAVVTASVQERRFEWPLTVESLVLDVGGYRGDFAAEMVKRYGCRVVVFEPVAEFRKVMGPALAALMNTGLVDIKPFGLAKADGETVFALDGDATGLYSTGREYAGVRLRDVVGWLAERGEPDVALLKLNVEGMEYEILERLLDAGRMSCFAAVLVQFHRVGHGFAARRERIRARLAETHREAWCEPRCWEAWERI